MVIKMKKNKKIDKETTDKIKISIVIIIIAVFVVLASIAYRNASYTHTWLVCEKDVAEHYHEVLKFRYDINKKMYGYYREERVHGVTPETLELNYQEYQKQLDQVKDNLDENFQYEIIKENNEVIAKTYIGVSIYPAFFNRYINNTSITSGSKIEDLQSYLQGQSYNCTVNRK